MRNLPEYFSGAAPPVALRLREFLGDCLDLVDEAGPVRVYRLEGC
jgi:hypothetical protein